MRKEIALVQKIFNVNFSPLTCTIMYVDKWDLFYLIVNEESVVLYNPERFTPILKFKTENDFVVIDPDVWYDPFDNFIPHLSKKIKIQTRRKTYEFDDYKIIDEQRPYKEEFEPGIMAFSGCVTTMTTHF